MPDAQIEERRQRPYKEDVDRDVKVISGSDNRMSDGQGEVERVEREEGEETEMEKNGHHSEDRQQMTSL